MVQPAQYGNRRRQGTEGLTEDEWPSCQIDVNKLVQRKNKADVVFSPEEAWPDETSDVAEIEDIKLENPCEIIDEVFKPEENYTETYDVDQNERTISPTDTPDVWLIEKLLCRCCHAEGQFISLQDMDPVNKITYEEMLATCYSIELLGTEVADPLRALCGLCAARLRDAHALCQQVRACEARFRTLYSNNCVRVAGTAELEIKEESAEAKNDEASGMDADGYSPDHTFEDKLAPEQLKETTTVSKPKKPVPKRKSFKTLPEPDWPASVLKDSVIKICSNRYKCKKCEKVFRKFVNFQRHERVHTERVYPCQYCKEPFKTTALRKGHIRKEHKEESRKPFTCQICKESFGKDFLRRKHKLEEHNIDESKRFQCNACDKTFTLANALSQHMRSYHKLGEVVKCAMCDYESYRKEALRKHMFRHKTSKDFQCGYCMKSFMRKATLLYHERIHTGDKRKVCAECGQAFVQKASLNYHMMKYHPAVKF